MVESIEEEIPSPYEFWRMADAMYKGNGLLKNRKRIVNEYIKKHTEGTISLKEIDDTSAKPWVFGLFCVHKNNERKLVVAFQGTNSLTQWADNIGTPYQLRAAAILSMRKVIRCWKKKYKKKYEKNYGRRDWGSIVASTGHSRGAEFAIKCLGSTVWVITWNGFEVKKGPRNVNLATKSDPLSTSKKISNPDDYIRICEGGHSLSDLKDRVRYASWSELVAEIPTQKTNEFILSPLKI